MVNMKLVILDDYERASEWAAKYVRNSILKFNPGPGKHFVLGLPTGEYIAELVSHYVYILHYVQLYIL